jgi:hypothetical protein
MLIMKTFSGIHTAAVLDTSVLSDREALRRMIQYAWVEAEKEGAEECAELLSAALLALDHACIHTDRIADRSVTN